ncbi:hypothetical protein V6N11_075125 [Hibiscus sabdariffa]|uniref:Pentatricopeptide repeat-containing protein n=1 Tax=Hibiscus sabdariffa TaxID=183260 RepID=A0ABR2R5J2_9ROSI
MNETGARLMAETYKLKWSRNNELGVAVWVALLSDCCNHGKSSIGKMVAKMVLELNPDILEMHALVSKFFAKKNMWGEVSFVRKLMKDSKKKKVCGYTALDVNRKLHAFLMRDNDNNFVVLLVSWKPQVDEGGGLESDAKKWVIAGISLRAPLKPIYTTHPVPVDHHHKDKETTFDDSNKEDEDSCSSSTTPTGQESRIPTLLTCPPAPMKTKPSLKCNYATVRHFFTPPDLDTVFIRHV